MNDDRVTVRTFVREQLSERGDHAAFGDTDSLLASGRLDSLAVAHFVMFLEETFGVDFARIEFDPQRFDTVDHVMAIIEESRTAGR